MPSDTDLLIDMGFDSERVKVAVTKSGGCKFKSHLSTSNYFTMLSNFIRLLHCIHTLITLACI